MSAQDVPVDFASRQDTAAAVHRNAGLDALRACLTLLVVFHHCAITYGALGGWYYHEVAARPSVESALLTLFCAINQAFFMGLFFFLAGYYTSPSIDRKGAARFLADRFIRLGLPLLVYGFVIGPATIALAQSGGGHPFADTLGRLWRKGTFENGPMWFAEALLMFSAAAALWHIAFRRTVACDTNRPDRNPFPSDRTLAAAALLTGIAALALRSRWPVGINVWGLQLGYFASYVVLYAAGYRTARVHWIEHLSARQVRLWWRIALLALPVLPVAYLLAKHVPALRGHPQEVIYAFWEPLVAWGNEPVSCQPFPAALRSTDGRMAVAVPARVHDLHHPSPGAGGYRPRMANRAGVAVPEIRRDRRCRLRHVLPDCRPPAPGAETRVDPVSAPMPDAAGSRRTIKPEMTA
ncbi:acyltransferase family protein [Burkholderia cepacia]|uniref:acyltransferase family protein n=1 Tax=Burkholderia cepacia TaxID=292 RepID=UPI003527B787